MQSSNKGKLFVVSAPSGAGKTTLITRVLERFGNLSYSVSHTTRSPRDGERHGRDYFFVSTDVFEQLIKDKELLEWARVHDNFYGTSCKFVEDTLAKGQSLLLDIDVQGAFQVMASGLEVVSIFILPPSMDELERRLTGRGTDSDDVIKKRLENARGEMAQKDKYNYVLINDDLEAAVKELCAVFEKEMG